MIRNQVLAFGKSEKSEFINIGIFAASLGGRKGRRQISRDLMGKSLHKQVKIRAFTGHSHTVNSLLFVRSLLLLIFTNLISHEFKILAKHLFIKNLHQETSFIANLNLCEPVHKHKIA